MLGKLFGWHEGRADPAALPDFGGGYFTIDDGDVARFTDCASALFPDLAGQVSCFGVDWSGRFFASDAGRMANADPLVTILDPATASFFPLPVTVADFLGRELWERADDALSLDDYVAWIESGGAAPSYGQCIGYIVPLFAGGADVPANLARTDVTTYWQRCADYRASA